MDNQSNNDLALEMEVEEMVTEFKMDLISKLQDYIEDHSGSNEAFENYHADS